MKNITKYYIIIKQKTAIAKDCRFFAEIRAETQNLRRMKNVKFDGTGETMKEKQTKNNQKKTINIDKIYNDRNAKKVGQIICYKNMKYILTQAIKVLYNADTLRGSMLKR